MHRSAWLPAILILAGTGLLAYCLFGFTYSLGPNLYYYASQERAGIALGAVLLTGGLLLRRKP